MYTENAGWIYIAKEENQGGGERQVESIKISQSNTIRNKLYKLIRLGFSIFLLISPIFPYLITGIHNNRLSVTFMAQAKALPVYPGTKLTAEDLELKPANFEPCQLRLRLQYQTKVPFEEVEKYYESTLQQSGWHEIDHNYYEQATMHIRVDRSFKSSNPKGSGFNKQGYRIKIFITTDVWQPIFQLGCQL